ncbi:MAG TPA: saccharopine dehydrogenase NADP-binding domain-containing protein [Jatrophihabitans sp.]|nr:saccharopine dehydrogenase NADP-binding domain-containing protein [Jatrophihabitans sp.]
MPEEQRPYDLVLLGATGFTGGLTAEYLARHAPAGLRWAIAGRNPARLAAVRDRLTAINPACGQLPLVTADSGDPASLAQLAGSARVVVSTVGPYLRYGEPLVAACAAAGTDYLDLTGEPEFVDAMYLRHHEQAVRTGARLIHCCGFDSIPHDLGVLYTVRQLPADVPITVDGVVRAGGRLSGGTLASALGAASRPRQAAAMARQRKQIEPRPADRTARAAASTPRRRDGLWLLPLPTVDPQIVARSARALPEYGPDFQYHHYAGVRRLPIALAGALGLAGLVGLAQLPPARRMLEARIASGSGPSAERRADSWFRVRFYAEAAGRRLVTEVSGGDPGYDETAKMLAEAAMCTALDRLPPSSGQVTTAAALGDALLTRLQAAGIEFRTIG